MESVRVELGSRSYPIHIGAGLIAARELYAPHLGAGGVAIVTNSVVAPLFLDAVKRATGSRSAIVVEDGEPAKSWRGVQQVIDGLLAARLGRDGLVIALGGGVIGDLAGFAAAIYQRGVPFVQVPTTLLAQVDSSVGGKTAINHPAGKNMIGAFHQPRAVISDVATLDELPERELRAGIAEVVKHGLALDRAFFEWLEANIEALMKRERGALVHAVKKSCELKARIVAEDEKESGARALLNLGHTFGHAIEAGTGYGTWLHGEAVAAGMVMASELSALIGHLNKADVGRVRDLLRRAGLPVVPPAIQAPRWRELMAVDKKAREGKLQFVLLERIGKAVLRGDVPDAALSATLGNRALEKN